MPCAFCPFVLKKKYSFYHSLYTEFSYAGTSQTIINPRKLAVTNLYNSTEKKIREIPNLQKNDPHPAQKKKSALPPPFFFFNWNSPEVHVYILMGKKPCI